MTGLFIPIALAFLVEVIMTMSKMVEHTPEEARCMVCKRVLKTGERMQAFLRCPNDPSGSWTKPVVVDPGFQERHMGNRDGIKRKHAGCEVPS